MNIISYVVIEKDQSYVIDVDLSTKVTMMINDGGADLREKKNYININRSKLNPKLRYDQRLATRTGGAWLGTSFTAGSPTTLPQDVSSMMIG